MPDDIVVSKTSPTLTHLCSLAQRRSVQIAENLITKLSWQGRDEINLDQIAQRGREERELLETALSEYTTEDKISML